MICGENISMKVDYAIAESLGSLSFITLILNTGFMLLTAKDRFGWLTKNQRSESGSIEKFMQPG